MAVKEAEGEREGKHTEMQTHIFTHSLAPAHTHAHTHTLLYQQNESAFWQYLNETEKSPIQPLCLAFINTARHWGDISLPSLAPSLLQTDTLTHTDMRTHTHKQREVSCSGMMMPPPCFPPTIPLFFVSSSSLVGFCYLTPSSYYCPFPPHLPPSPLSHSLSPCSLSVCLPLPLNENTHRCVKGRSNSTYPPVAAAASLTLSLWGREDGSREQLFFWTILQALEEKPKRDPGAHLFEAGHCLLESQLRRSHSSSSSPRGHRERGYWVRRRTCRVPARMHGCSLLHLLLSPHLPLSPPPPPPSSCCCSSVAIQK